MKAAYNRPSRNSRPLLSTLAAAALVFALWFALTASAQQPGVQALSDQADEVLHQMSRITGLPVKGPLNKQVLSRPEIAKYITDNLHEEMTPREIHAQEALVRTLGVVPRDFSLEKFLVGFYTEQAAGFYDFKRKTMFIADWVPPEVQGMTLAHELTHALQDQNFDLDKYMHAHHDDDDATAARLAVVEGYATAAMFQQQLAQEGLGQMDLGQLGSLTGLMEEFIPEEIAGSPQFSSAPYFFKEQALFPYVQGVGFIQAGLQLGGWKSLNIDFEQPPVNTREIFDPPTYFGHAKFSDVPLPRPPALESMPALKFLTGNIMGELGYYALIGQLLSEDEARKIAPAWVGDRYLLYEQAGADRCTLLARTRWATPEAAQEFFRDYQSILSHKYPELVGDQRSSADLFIASTSKGGTVLRRDGSECAWAEGVPAALLDSIAAWLRSLEQH